MAASTVARRDVDRIASLLLEDPSNNVICAQADSAGALKVTGSLSVGGTTDNTAFIAGSGTGTPSMGFYHSTIDTVTDGDVAVIGMTSKRAQFVNLQTAAGAETGVAAAPLQVSLANTGANGTAVTVSATNLSSNIAQINGVTPLMGNGVTGTGSLRVTIASDNTAFSVNATLSAETTKVIGTVRNLGNAGAIFDGVNTAATAPANGVLGLGIYNSTEPSPTTGQSVGIQQDSKGRQRMVIMDAAANTRGVNVDANNNMNVILASNTGVDIGKLTANQSVNVAQMNGVTTTMGNGVSGTGVQRIAIASDNTAIAGWGQGATAAAVPSGAQYQGAQARSSELAAATNANLVGLVTDLASKLIVLPYANPENFVSGVTAAMTGTTTTSLLAAPAAGLRNYITHIIGTNSHATVGTFIIIQDGSGGTTLYEGYAAAVGGGFSITLPTPLRQPTTATAIFCANVTTGANTIVAATGYKGI